MPNKSRQRGDYFERQTRLALEVWGWWVVRAAGSLGVADLVALRADRTPLLVSCKADGRIGPAERTALIETAHLAGARAILASRSKPGRIGLAAVKAADARPYPLEELRAPPRKRKPTPEPDAVHDDDPLPEPVPT